MVDYANLDDGTSITVLALNEGEWGNSIWVSFTDFDDLLKEYTIGVILEQDGHRTIVEEWRVSHTEKVDGNGSQMHAEKRINGKSEYIEVIINLHSSAPPLPRHQIENEGVVFDSQLSKFVNTTSFTLVPGSLKVVTDEATNNLIFDDSKGGLSGPGGNGSIDYDTATLNIAFTLGTTAKASYQYESMLQLTGGTNGNAPTENDYINALDIYRDADDVAFEFFVEAQYLSPNYQNAIVELCEQRKDCIAFLSVPVFSDFRDLLVWRKASTISSSYAMFFAPLVQIKESGSLVNVPAPAHAASSYVENTDLRGPWSAVAGEVNGEIECIGTSQRYSNSEMLQLINSQINPIVPHYQEGAILFSQKTSLKVSNVFQNAHVRRLMIYIRASAEDYLRSKTFKVNDADLREEVTKQLSQFLAIVQANGGLSRFAVVCDRTNNTSATIDANRLNVDLYCAPHDILVDIQVTLASNGRTVTAAINTNP